MPAARLEFGAEKRGFSPAAIDLLMRRRRSLARGRRSRFLAASALLSVDHLAGA
jgi:hypothetical protein